MPEYAGAVDRSARQAAGVSRRSAGTGAAKRPATRTGPPVIQAQLVVGAADDALEREADHVAAAVLADLGRQREPGLLDPVATSRIRRRSDLASPSSPDVTDDRPSTRIRASGVAGSAVGMRGGALDGATGSAIERARGAGRPLEDQVRRSMGGAFGSDFSGVRIHDDAAAHDISTRIQAKAFTTGADIFFGRGQFRPTARAGQELLAHELAHVVQQGGAARTDGRASAPTTSASASRRVLRKFDGALGKLTISQIMDELRATYDKVPVQWKVEQLMWLTDSSNTAIVFTTVKEIGDHFGLTRLPTTSTATKAGALVTQGAVVSSGGSTAVIDVAPTKVRSLPSVPQQPSVPKVGGKQELPPKSVPMEPIKRPSPTIDASAATSSVIVPTPVKEPSSAPTKGRSLPTPPQVTVVPKSGGQQAVSSTVGATVVKDVSPTPTKPVRGLPTAPQISVVPQVAERGGARPTPSVGTEKPTKSVQADLSTKSSSKPATQPSSTSAAVTGKGAVVAKEEPEADGMFTVTGIQGNVNPPVDKKRVITRPGKVSVTSGDGKTQFTVLPGQTFLNTSLSEYLSRNPPPAATINLKKPPPQNNEPPDVRVISDAHHRFVWGAVAGRQVSLKEPTGVAGAQAWGDMAYGPSTNKGGEGQPRSTKITDVMREKYFQRWVGLGRAMTPRKYVKKTIDAHPSTENTPETVGDYSAYIEQRIKAYTYKFGYREFVDDLTSKLGPEGARYREQLLARKVDPNAGVLVVGDNPASRGHYDPAAKVINLQQNTPMALLDTLLFETGNVERTTPYAELERTKIDAKLKGYRKAEIEYEVDVQYIDSLHEIHGAKTLDQLVVALRIDKRFLVKQDVSAALGKTKPPYVDMPSSAELPVQSHRQALWFWKTQDWDLKDRRHVWVIENHTNLGMGASDQAYTRH